MKHFWLKFWDIVIDSATMFPILFFSGLIIIFCLPIVLPILAVRWLIEQYLGREI